MKNRTEVDKKIEYISFISVVSCFSVLALHTNGCFWIFSATAKYWKTANFIECFFYSAVPCFFMITGITLMDFYDKYTIKEYFVRRFKKTVIPFLAWNCIAIIAKFCNKRLTISDINLVYLYKGITRTEIIPIYWFFTQLFIIYLCLPLFAAVDKQKRKNVFTYLVVFGFLLNICVPLLKQFSKFSFLYMPYNLPVVSCYLIYPLLGWLLHNCEIKNREKYIIYLTALIGFLVHWLGTYYFSLSAGKIVRTFKGYLNVPCIFYSIGIFVFLKDIGTKIMKFKVMTKMVNFISSYTFSIYLMQFIFLGFFPRFINPYSMVYRLGIPFVIIPIIIFITWGMRQFPVIKRIVP